MRSSADPRGWLLVAGVAAAGSVAAGVWPATLLDWQPAQAVNEPWRWWTAAFVHWTPLHLAANLVGVVVVATFGVLARLPRHAALAWALAWPLTHGALLLQPGLLHYGGLSGVLHAGVAVAATGLLIEGSGRQRLIGAAVALGLALKIVLERPWDGPLSQPAGWDIAVAPGAHAAGALAGLACALVCLGWQAKVQPRRTMRPR